MEDASWYRRRGYAHFDRPPSEAVAREYVTDAGKVAKHGFFPLIMRPLRTVYMKSKDGQRRYTHKTRAIAYAAHMDTMIHAYYSKILAARLEATYAEQGISPCVLAYRAHNPPKSNVDFACDVFSEIRERRNCEVLALDVEAFFDSLDQQLLKAAWQKLLGEDKLPPDHFAVFKSVTRDYAILWPKIRSALKDKQRRRAGRTGEPICELAIFRKLLAPLCQPRFELVEQLREQDERRNSVSIPHPPATDVRRPRRGIPQGTAISATLANLYMLDFDIAAAAEIQKFGGSYRRYSDDIAIIVPAGMGKQAAQAVESLITSVRKLTIKRSKTEHFRFAASTGDPSDPTQSCTCLEDDQPTKPGRPFRYLGLAYDGKSVAIRDGTMSRFAVSATKAVSAAASAAVKNHAPMRLRKLLASKSQLGPGRAYGKAAKLARGRKQAPRPGFHKYLWQAEKKSSSRKFDLKIPSQRGATWRRLHQIIALKRPKPTTPPEPDHR